MGKVTYDGGRAWRTRAFGGLTFSDGETQEVSDGAEEWLVENHDFERAEDTEDAAEDESNDEYAVLNESIDDLEAELDAGDRDDHLADLKRVEEEHKDRAGAKEAIDERRRHLADSEDEGAEE